MKFGSIMIKLLYRFFHGLKICHLSRKTSKFSNNDNFTNIQYETDTLIPPLDPQLDQSQIL